MRPLPITQRRFVSGPCPHTPVWRCQFFFTIKSVSSFLRHFVFSSFTSIQFLFLQHLPISCFLLFSPLHTLLLTYILMIVPSRKFRMCGFFSSSTTMFPARTTFCIDWDERFNHSPTSEFHAPLNTVIRLEWNILLPQVSDLFTIRCYKLL